MPGSVPPVPEPVEPPALDPLVPADPLAPAEPPLLPPALPPPAPPPPPPPPCAKALPIEPATKIPTAMTDNICLRIFISLRFVADNRRRMRSFLTGVRDGMSGPTNRNDEDVTDFPSQTADFLPGRS